MSSILHGRPIDAQNKPLDHIHYHPADSVAIRTAGTGDDAVPASAAAFIDPAGRLSVDISVVSAAQATGTLNIYLWDDALAAPVLFQTESFDTAAVCVHRYDVAGRPFAIQLAGVTATMAVKTTYTLL